LNIPRQRLHNQYLARATFEEPGDVVRWLGAVQAQDYRGALWAVGLRTSGATEDAIERAIADRTIVRTWPLRGTLHFVAPEDVRWMLKVLAPRMVARSALRHKQLALDEALFARSTKLIVKALQGGRALTRDAMYARLEAAHISTVESRGLHILWRIAHDGVICFGQRQGRQQTFVLLDEWVPAARALERDEALAELARRYYTSHGPATLQDFSWWSGLSAADARAGLEMASAHLRHETIGGRAYWVSSSMTPAGKRSRMAWLLPPYDEYTVAYQDRSAVLDPTRAARLGNGIFSPTIVVDGQVVGTWTRRLEKGGVVVVPRLLAKLGGLETRAVAAAVERYGRFLGVRAKASSVRVVRGLVD
jgi:hypothetical protein